MDTLLWAGIGMVALGVGVWRLARGRTRQRELMLLCHRAGLDFMPMDPFTDTLWMPFGWLGPGRWVEAENVVWNGADGDAVRAFDLVTEQAATGPDDAVTHRRYTCATVALPLGCPRLEIGSRDPLGDAVDAVTGEDIGLELEEFNRRFRVRCPDRRFAVAFCDQRMMAAMMALPSGVTIAVNEDTMLLRAPVLPAPQVLLLLEAARAIAKRVPPVVASLYPPRPMKGPHEDRWLQGYWSPEPTGESGSRTTLPG